MTKQTGELTELKGVITEGVRLWGLFFNVLCPVLRLMGQLTRSLRCVCVCVCCMYYAWVGLPWSGLSDCLTGCLVGEWLLLLLLL